MRPGGKQQNWVVDTWTRQNQKRSWTGKTPCTFEQELPFEPKWLEPKWLREIKSTLSRSSICPWISFALEIWTGLTVLESLWYVFPWRTATIRSHKSSAEFRPTLILHPRKWFLILLNCAKLKFVSYTSSWLEQTYDFRKCTMFLQK